MSEQLITMDEAAEYIKLDALPSSLPTIFTRLGKRGLTAVKYGRKRMYYKSDIDAFLNKQKYISNVSG